MFGNPSLDFLNLDRISTTKNDFFSFMENILPSLAVGKTSCKVVEKDEKSNFKLFLYTKGDKEKRVLLFIPHIINRPYILDLNEDVSVIKRFCEHNLTVYMIDWGYPTMEQRKISFFDYVQYVNKVVNFIEKKEGVKKISILGYCTGGIISLMYTSLYPEKMEKLILMATPVDFSLEYDPRLLWGKVFNVRSIVSFFGNIPGELIVFAGRHLFMLYFPFYSLSREFITEFLTYETWRDTLRLNRWFLDNPMIPGSAYIQFIEDCYQHNLLIKNQMKINSHRIDLGKISCPLLNILAQYDHLIPIFSGRALGRVYSGKNYQEIIFPSTHIGLAVSKKAHLNLWPRVGEWLKDN